MKKQMLMVVLVVGMLLAGGCGKQQSIEQWNYVVQQTPLGYSVVITNHHRYTFKENIASVWQDKQFRAHTIFWLAACSYPVFIMPSSMPIITTCP